MAPNAEQVRLRNVAKGIQTKDTTEDEATMPTLDSMKQLKSNEVAIEGVIYDLNSFVHPGGDSVKLFGGNDVTVQYKMIHPYHTAKHLQKMTKVGEVSNYKSHYLFDTEFEREIKREVFKIVRRGKEYGTNGFFFRAFCYLALYFALITKINQTGFTWALAIAFGVSQSLIGLNVQHDANHGAMSRKAWVNDLFGFGADMIGGQKWNWQVQHWTHHAYTNHKEMDPDAFNAEPMLLFNDYPLGHPARKFYHKFQSVFFLPVLSGYWLSMVLNPQVFDLKHRGAEGIGINVENDFLKSRRIVSTLLRMIYIYFVIIHPMQIAQDNGENLLTTFAQILTMGCAESLALASLFALSHNFENVDRDPTGTFDKSGKQVCWFKAQVETSSTYGGFIAGALTGGLNFQVEHHLFPRMSSAYYPYIAPKVREICKKHGVRYAYYPWVWQNFISTVKWMHATGTGSNHLMTPLKGDL